MAAKRYLRQILLGPENPVEYEPLHEEAATALDDGSILEGMEEEPFSWWEYGTFAFLGMAMLWAW
jgi:solute carrier family 29 (equilibrative nucleoside transporter), member 1/2/3